LDESSGPTAFDSALDNHGTVSGATFQPTGGHIDGALSFDGIDDYVDIDLVADDVDVSQGTIACWLKLDPAHIDDSVTHGLVEIGNTSSGNYVIALRKISDETIRMRYRSGGVNYDASISDISDFANWHHVAAVWTDTQVKIYLDGIPQDTQSRGSDITDPLNFARIGRTAHGTFETYANGLFDDVRIYSRALNNDEITALSSN